MDVVIRAECRLGASIDCAARHLGQPVSCLRLPSTYLSDVFGLWMLLRVSKRPAPLKVSIPVLQRSYRPEYVTSLGFQGSWRSRMLPHACQS